MKTPFLIVRNSDFKINKGDEIEFVDGSKSTIKEISSVELVDGQIKIIGFSYSKPQNHAQQE